MTKYIYTQDPAHGWIRVKRAEIKRLGIEDKISKFSYQKGEYVYLEEDCDAGLFLQAKEALGEKYNIISKHVEHTSIREYHHYVP